MTWRCTWCGKPHEENDPPCDSCGHNTFEKAVARDESGATARETEPKIDPETGTVDTGTQYLWICADCGRQHMRNNPPCSRCGSHNLEQTEQNYEDIERELETPSWLEVAKPYLPIVVVIGIAAVLFATGVIPLSVLPGLGAPSPPDAPGNGTAEAGIDLEATEDLVYDRLEDERSADASRIDDDGLAAYAEYVNRASVASRYDDENSRRVEPSDFGVDCERTGSLLALESGLGESSDEEELAANVADALLDSDGIPATEPGFEREGVDIHVGPNPDETVYVFYATC